MNQIDTDWMLRELNEVFTTVDPTSKIELYPGESRSQVDEGLRLDVFCELELIVEKDSDESEITVTGNFGSVSAWVCVAVNDKPLFLLRREFVFALMSVLSEYDDRAAFAENLRVLANNYWATFCVLLMCFKSAASAVCSVFE
jgi:hypothetical protein